MEITSLSKILLVLECCDSVFKDQCCFYCCILERENLNCKFRCLANSSLQKCKSLYCYLAKAFFSKIRIKSKQLSPLLLPQLKLNLDEKILELYLVQVKTFFIYLTKFKKNSIAFLDNKTSDVL